MLALLFLLLSLTATTSPILGISLDTFLRIADIHLNDELSLSIPTGYELDDRISMQNKWFRRNGKPFQFRDGIYYGYSSIAYGKPYAILEEPALHVSINNSLLVIFSQPNTMYLRTAFREFTHNYREQYGLQHMFVMSNCPDNSNLMKDVRSESSTFHDILLFNHTNSYSNLALSVLLTYHYLQKLKVALKYVIKVDDDCAVSIPNLMKHLQGDIQYLYAGDCIISSYNSRDSSRKNYIPYALVYDEKAFSYARGGIYVLSYSLLTPILIITRHSRFVSHLEDTNTGRGLKKVGVECTSLNEKKWLARWGCISYSECREFVAIHPKSSSLETIEYYRWFYESH